MTDKDTTVVHVKKKRGPKPKIDEFYVNPHEFKQEIVDYYESGVCIPKLADALKKIAYGLGNKSNFINYTYKEEMIGDALVKMFTALKNQKFRVESDFSPFSYFTTIAFHAFINRIKKEKKYHETLTTFKEKVYEEELTNQSGGMIYIKPNSDDIDYSE